VAAFPSVAKFYRSWYLFLNAVTPLYKTVVVGLLHLLQTH